MVTLFNSIRACLDPSEMPNRQATRIIENFKDNFAVIHPYFLKKVTGFANIFLNC